MRTTRARTATAVLLLALGGALALPAGAGAATNSLWRKSGTAPRPGPPLLYESLANAPQLENAAHSVWHAKPILVSGASAYRTGEFLYQGFIYDDHGAKEVTDPKNPMHSPGGDSSGGDLFSAPDGTYDYPSGPGYDENAANLTELRVKPLSKATVFRVGLNTLEDPSLVATAIAIGGSEGTTHPFPFGSNVRAPAQYFLTIHGQTAVLTDAVTEAPVPGPAPVVSVDLARRQITVQVPHSEWNPGTSVVRLAAAVGLWDNSTGRYLLPQGERSETRPGGAGEVANPPAFFDVAFRFNAQEPMPGTPSPGTTADPAWWRESAQSKALAAKDISPFHAEVDFSKLAAKVNDDMPGGATGVPQTGAFDRIYASHFSLGQGADYATGGCGKASECIGAMRGQLLPYAIYVPSGGAPAGGYGLTLLLHSLSANYNQYLGSKNQSQFANRAGGSIVITPTGRGPDGWYYDHAGADTFEVWADVASRYPLNPAFTDIAGYSMGGYGTYKFSTQFPDLFAKAQPTVGPPGLGIWAPPTPPTGGEQTLTQRMLASVRNIPFLIWNAVQDELVPYAGPVQQAQTFDDLGYRYRFDSFAPAEHLTLAIHDQYQPAADFLGKTKVGRNPPHVTYVLNPKMNFKGVGTVANHAYWLSGLRVRDAAGDAPFGTIDVRSHGFGVGDPVPGATQHSAGALGPGTLGELGFTEQSKAWEKAPAESAIDVLDVRATNVSRVTINPGRARVDCDAQIDVKSDGPLAVTLAGCGRTALLGGPRGSCDSSRPPGASVSGGGSRLGRRRISLRGRAVAFRCAGGRSVAGTVTRVRVSVSQAVGLRCRFLKGSGRLSGARSCSRPIRLRARLGRIRPGKVPWAFSRGVHLRRGRYRVAVAAVDARGLVGGRRGRFSAKSFVVR
jgi:hypothetical protein